jgi:MFS family permease
VAALGYFVDIYDLLLFGIVRVPSLASLGYHDTALQLEGEFLVNVQMAGLLLGGILWGVLGDRKGRLSVLFGSIVLYSTANLLNAFVTDLTSYAVLRFIAGIGLAGELGAGVTLVAELMPKEKRGYGTTVIAAFGLLGAVAAGGIARIDWPGLGIPFESWRVCYFIGGALGLLLLVLRIGVYESGMYQQTREEGISRGNFFYLFSSWRVFSKYLRCILIGLPTWFTVGILIYQCLEFGKHLGFGFRADPAVAIMTTYVGLSVGDLACGLLSQALRSRKQAMYTFVGLTGVFILVYLNLGPGTSETLFLAVCFMLGISTGFWAVFVTIASEQFGTNIRATVTTTVPNFVRGALIPITWLNAAIRNQSDMSTAAYIVGGLCVVISLVSIYQLEETFSKDLNYTEGHSSV